MKEKSSYKVSSFALFTTTKFTSPVRKKEPDNSKSRSQDTELNHPVSERLCREVKYECVSEIFSFLKLLNVQCQLPKN